MGKRGVLLMNVGTPEAPTVDAVRTYLREFLLDPDVIDLPAPLRHLFGPWHHPANTSQAYCSGLRQDLDGRRGRLCASIPTAWWLPCKSGKAISP